MVDGKQDIVRGIPKCYNGSAQLVQQKQPHHHREEAVTGESFQLQMRLSFPLLRANDLRTSLLIMRTCSLSYVGLYLNLIANAVNNNDQHVRSGTNVRIGRYY